MVKEQTIRHFATLIAKEKVKKNVVASYYNPKTRQYCIKWKDGVVTTAKCSSGDEPDIYVGFALAWLSREFVSKTQFKKIVDSVDKTLNLEVKKEEVKEEVKKYIAPETVNNDLIIPSVPRKTADEIEYEKCISARSNEFFLKIEWYISKLAYCKTLDDIYKLRDACWHYIRKQQDSLKNFGEEHLKAKKMASDVFRAKVIEFKKNGIN